MAKKKATRKKSTRKRSARKSTRKSSAPRRTKAPARPRSSKSSNMQTRAIIGLIVNLLVLPGVGTIIGGDTKTGVWQLVLFIIGIPLALLVVGILLMIGVWIWAIVSSVQQLQRAY